MFHDTFDACCNAIFNPDGNNANFSCEKYDVICHNDDGGGGGPTPVSSPDSGSNECKYGWHVNRATNAGCTNNEEVVEGWLAPALVDKMFFSRLEDCCLTFFPNSKGDCPGDDIGCYQPGDTPLTPDTPPDTPSPTNKPTNGPTNEPTNEPEPPADNPAPVPSGPLFEDMEVSEVSSTKFTTSSDKPWTISDEYAVSGSKSIKNALTSRGESSKLTLSMDYPTRGVVFYELRHGVYMPWAQIQVYRDQELVVGFQGHTGDATWSTEHISVTEGTHDIVWDVNTFDMALPPGTRGSGTVWIDDVRFVETVLFDWEDSTIDQDLVSFKGIGRWKIDDTMPGPADSKSLSIHSPRGLLPGEDSSMIIKQNSPSGGLCSFDVHIGLGKVLVYVDGVLSYSKDGPGGDTVNYAIDISPGEHTYEFKYQPPPHANMPMSMVWIDNIMITV